MTDDLREFALEILNRVQYMTMGTVGPDGRPRVSPVWFTPVGDHLYWLSSPTAQHSINIAERPDVEVVVFDSTAPIGQGRAVYLTATAAQVPENELAEASAVAFRPTPGIRAYGPEDLTGSAPLRLYRADVHTMAVHLPRGHPRRPEGIDTRVPVE